MYRDIGEKIKGLAIVIFFIEAIASVIGGFILWMDNEEWWCILIIIIGPFLAWVSSWLLYGFGEIIDKLCDIERNTRGGKSTIEIKRKADRIEKEALAKAEWDEEDPYDEIETIVIGNTEYIEFMCPTCQEFLSFKKGTGEMKCPFCDSKIEINK